MPLSITGLTSPAYLMAQCVETICHDMITNPHDRQAKLQNDLTFFMNKIKLAPHGRTTCRVLIAICITEVCDSKNEELERWTPGMWRSLMRKLKSIHDALSRKDAHQFIVPELYDNGYDEEEDGDGDGDDDDNSGSNEGNENDTNENENVKSDNTTGQNSQAMRTSDIRKKACRDLLRILRRHAALSIIRDDLNKLLGEDADEENDMNINRGRLEEFISCIRKDQMKFDKEGVRKLTSLLSVQDLNNVNIKNATFRSAVKVKEILNSRLLSLETLKDHMSIILTHWYDTLPLPDLTHIGNYNIHQVKNNDSDESLLDAELELSQSQSIEGSQSQSVEGSQSQFIEDSQDRPDEERDEESEEEEEEDENDENFLSTQENTNIDQDSPGNLDESPILREGSDDKGNPGESISIKEEDEGQEYQQEEEDEEEDERSDEEQEYQQEEDEQDERFDEQRVAIKEEDEEQEYQEEEEDEQDEQSDEQQELQQDEENEQDEQSDGQQELPQEEDEQDEQLSEQQELPQEEENEQDEQSDEQQELPQEEDAQDEQLSEEQELPPEELEEEEDVNLSEMEEEDVNLSEQQEFQQELDEQDVNLSEQQEMQHEEDEQDEQASEQQEIEQDEGSLASASFATAREVEENDFSSSNDPVNNLVEKRTALGRHKDPLQDMYNVAGQAYQASENIGIVDKTPQTAPARSYRMNQSNGDDDDEGENGNENDEDEIESVESTQMNRKHRSPRTHDFYARKKSAKQLRFEETNDSLGGDFPTPPPIPSPPRKKQKRSFWTDEETDALVEGFETFGTDWAKIREAHYDVLKNRSNINLKDKYRNLNKKRRKP